MKLRVRYVPVVISTTLLIALVITTFLAYYQKHVTSVIPYISDTGTLPPESCIFGQFLNMVWVMLSFGMYCKFLQVKDILQKHNMCYEECLNRNTFILGLLAAFGVSIVANFQETNCWVVHWIGAVMCFGLGSLYICMQTILYLQITPVIGQIRITKIRIMLSALAVLTFLIYFVCAMTSFKKFVGESYLHWKSEHGGYELHLTSVITEWVCASVIMIYLFTFREEFQHMIIHEPVIDTGIAKFQSKRDLHPVNIADIQQ